MKNKKVKTLNFHQALKAGADLWMLSDKVSSQQWNAQVDWYMNFLITKNSQRVSSSLSEKRKFLLKQYDTHEFQEFLDIREFNTLPLLIKSSLYLPNILTLVLKYNDQWLPTVYDIWCSLKKPQLRIFAPKQVTKEMIEETWKDETQDIECVVDE